MGLRPEKKSNEEEKKMIFNDRVSWTTCDLYIHRGVDGLKIQEPFFFSKYHFIYDWSSTLAASVGGGDDGRTRRRREKSVFISLVISWN